MKHKSIKLIAIAGITSFLLSCGNSQSKKQNDKQGTNGGEPSASMYTSSPISNVVGHYINLKNALVSSNSNEATNSAKGLLEALNGVDTSKFTVSQKDLWSTHAGILKENAEHIKEGSEISHQREHLNSMSESMLKLVKTFGGGKPLYYEFCPMANNNTGGYWLSESEKIKNPYFGDDMLECGEVKEIVK